MVNSLRVEVRSDDVVGNAGNMIPRMLADTTGLTSGMSAVLSLSEVLYDSGAGLRDVAASIARREEGRGDGHVEVGAVLGPQRFVRVVSPKGGEAALAWGELVGRLGGVAAGAPFLGGGVPGRRPRRAPSKHAKA